MGRELKRVPLDFDYPMKKVWIGYLMDNITTCLDDCERCMAFAKIKNIPIDKNLGCPDIEEYFKEEINSLRLKCEVPQGDGYQLWETTTEGSPVSPVFQTLDELCEWCEDNATTFGSMKATKEEWKRMLDDNFVYHKDKNNNIWC